MFPSLPLGFSVILPEQLFIHGSGGIEVRTALYYHWTSCIGPWLLYIQPWSLRPRWNHLLIPWRFKLITCMLGGWSTRLFLHVLCCCFFLHDRLGLVPGLHFLYSIWSFRGHGWFCVNLPATASRGWWGRFRFWCHGVFFLNNFKLTLLRQFYVGHNHAHL